MVTLHEDKIVIEIKAADPLYELGMYIQGLARCAQNTMRHEEAFDIAEASWACDLLAEMADIQTLNVFIKMPKSSGCISTKE